MQLRCLVALAGIAMSPGATWAGEDSLFVAGGPLLGASSHEHSNGLLVGGELSSGWLHMGLEPTAKPYWIGAYADVLYDSATAGRVSIGPELGYFMFGFDAGVVHELGGSDRWGFSGRGSLSIPVSWTERPRSRLTTITTLSVYVRRVSWRDDSDGHTELGLLVKMALPALAGGNR
jgi:hypothetical protein